MTMENIQIIEQKIKWNPIKRQQEIGQESEPKKENAQLYHNKGGKRKASTAVSKKGKLEENERENENSITATVVAFLRCVCVCVCGGCPEGFSSAQVMRNANRHTGGKKRKENSHFLRGP